LIKTSGIQEEQYPILAPCKGKRRENKKKQKTTGEKRSSSIRGSSPEKVKKAYTTPPLNKSFYRAKKQLPQGQ